MTYILKPCPFCGNADIKEVYRTETVGHGETASTVGVSCCCGVSLTKEHYVGYLEKERMSEYVMRWNTRTNQA